MPNTCDGVVHVPKDIAFDENQSIQTLERVRLHFEQCPDFTDIWHIILPDGWTAVWDTDSIAIRDSNNHDRIIICFDDTPPSICVLPFYDVTPGFAVVDDRFFGTVTVTLPDGSVDYQLIVLVGGKNAISAIQAAMVEFSRLSPPKYRGDPLEGWDKPSPQT